MKKKPAAQIVLLKRWGLGCGVQSDICYIYKRETSDIQDLNYEVYLVWLEMSPFRKSCTRLPYKSKNGKVYTKAVL